MPEIYDLNLGLPLGPAFRPRRLGPNGVVIEDDEPLPPAERPQPILPTGQEPVPGRRFGW